MIYAWKYVGETPLQCIQRLRESYTPLSDTKLSYAGRLDPMASGVLPILVGEENKEYKTYLSADKTYDVSFLVGVSTDSFDVLGRHLTVLDEQSALSEDELVVVQQKIKQVEQQTYPWFSSATVNGIKLFDHFKAGNTTIERPHRKVTVHEISSFTSETITTNILYTVIQNAITKVHGDFRQDEILQDWKRWRSSSVSEWQVVSCKISVSSGTYIRALTELFPVPVTVLYLQRNAVLF